MNLNKKLGFLCLILLGGLSYLGYVHYKRTHPVYVPPPREEVEITIIPGWNLRDVAEYLVQKGFASTTDQVYTITGKPAYMYSQENKEEWPPYPVTARAIKPTTSSEKITQIEMWKPENISYEGYLAPETYRVYRDASVLDVVAKMVKQRDKEIPEKFHDDAISLKELLDHPREMFQILTMASIIERETKHNEDRAKVSDILWRRYQRGMRLQVDSSVHYLVDRTGDVFTTDQERAIESPWNTYRTAGLPPGPICNPSVASIKAALYPEKNEYWYFLSDSEGYLHYAKTLDEHNSNIQKYLR